jgi:hypothetical protein
MASTSIQYTIGVIRAIGVGVAALGLSFAWAQASETAQDVPFFEMQEFGVVPRPAVVQVLLDLPAVQQDRQ